MGPKSIAHYRNGAAVQPDVVPADILAKTPDGKAATMRRWVLQEQVWTKQLDQAGLAGITTRMLPASGKGPRLADTLMVTACRRV